MWENSLPRSSEAFSFVFASVSRSARSFQVDVNSVAKAPEILEKVLDSYYGNRYIIPNDISYVDITRDVREETHMPKREDAGALTEPTFYILLSLHKPTHGYAIMQDVRELTGGRVNIGAGTLYRGGQRGPEEVHEGQPELRNRYQAAA